MFKKYMPVSAKRYAELERKFKAMCDYAAALEKADDVSVMPSSCRMYNWRSTERVLVMGNNCIVDNAILPPGGRLIVHPLANNCVINRVDVQR